MKNFNNKAGTKLEKELKVGLIKKFPAYGTENKYRHVANYLAPNYRGLHLHDLNKVPKTTLDIKLLVSFPNRTPETISQQVSITDDETADLSPTSKLKRKFMAKKSNPSTQAAHEKILPILASVAKVVLSIPCSISKSERVFSCEGNFATLKGNKLGQKKLEDLIILKENKKNILLFKAETGNLKQINDIVFNIDILENGLDMEIF